MPFGTILNPIYASSTSSNIVGYTRCGDSALWTGAYLAAESFRYNVTQSQDALNNVKAALSGIESLVDVTGDNRLARCIVPANSAYAAGIESEEAANTIHQAPPYIWVDNTSRDQVVGIFFGLGAAYDLVDDAGVKSRISSVTTLISGFISGHQWSPNDDISNTFLVRPEELQMLSPSHAPRESFEHAQRAVLHSSGELGRIRRRTRTGLLFQVQPGLHDLLQSDPASGQQR